MIRPTLEPGSSGSPSMRSGPERPSPLDEVRCALISAVCHAHRNALHEGAPPFLTPMPLDRLVDVLRSGGNDLARVMAACWLLDNPSQAEIMDPHATLLLGPEMRGGLTFPVGLPGSISFTAPPEIVAGSIPETRFTYACNKLFGRPPCSPANHLLGVWFDLGTLVTTIEASVQVQRKPDAFRKHADPRGWERNAALFFKKSEVCDRVYGDFETRPNPPEIGDKDYQELLLEHVSVGFAPGFPIESINVLGVDCRSQRPSPRFEVSLHACLEMQLGLSWSRGGLDVDSGIFETTPVPGATRVRGTKVARFVEREVFGQPIGRQLNYFAPFCLAALMSTLIFGGACYDPI